MRPRTLILLILVLVVGAATVALLVLNQQNGGLFTADEPVTETTDEGPLAEEGSEPGIPVAAATPSIRLETVVVAVTDLPIGERIRSDLITTEERPNDNIALQGGYAFSDPEELIGQIAKVPISKGQEILRPMVALNPTDIATSGSDLALYVDNGKVAVAFPIDQFAGIAYALRPGDLVDAMMTLSFIAVDPEFNTALPNMTQRVREEDLLAGRSFLFPARTQGRLEFSTDINQVIEFVPNENDVEGVNITTGVPIPRRVTQLTVQQAEVLWVGTWRDPREFEKAAEAEAAMLAATGAVGEEGAPVPTATVEPDRFETRPDVIILSMFTQDALALKWALERGIDIDLALRSQGDTNVYNTAGVSLVQLIEQGVLPEPQAGDQDIAPRGDLVPAPSLPANPPRN